MSQPPHDPYRRPPQRPGERPGTHPPQGGYRAEPYGDRYDDSYQSYGDPRDHRGERYGQQQYRQAPRPPAAPAPARQQEYRRPEPPAPSRSSGGSGFRLPGAGVLLAIIGSIVQLVSVLLLPWVASGKGHEALSLYQVWTKLSDGGAHSFGDWYVALFSYPLAGLGILLAFAAVLESVAAKIVWGVLALLGLAFLVLRYGLGPLTGLAGSKSAMHFSTVEVVVAVVALVAVLVVAFTLKLAVSTFRRVAGIILIVLSGVHVSAVMDLFHATSLSDLSFGAFGPSAGYLLIGIAALIGPRRLLPGL